MKYVIGIDLGTTNTELAYCSLDDATAVPVTFEIPQFVAPSTIESRDQLPSFLYIGSETERSLADWKLPWDSLSKILEEQDALEKNETASSFPQKSGGFFKRLLGFGNKSERNDEQLGMTNPNAFYLVGEIASRRSSETPEQTVASAKSWLTCTKVDRLAPILPWNVSNDLSKISPVEASRLYLTHLVSAWNHAFPDGPIFDQQVVLTVPASFDESARELTRKAAVAAGLNPKTLLFLEEPQAALYSWLAQEGDSWRDSLQANDVILVCDVGGGTTDLSLIRVEDEEGDLVLRRLAVGNRLLLGGDNIDLALAYRTTEIFAQQGQTLNPWQSVALQRQCRKAKERLLRSEYGEDVYKITVLGRSSRLIGDSISVDLPKRDAESIVLDGFFPLCSLSDKPEIRRGLGLRETGLSYESDPAITRHVASFLRSCVDENGEIISPTYFVLNGGVFKSGIVAQRIQDQLQQWFPKNSPRNLSPNSNLDQAVSHGAAFYGLVKAQGGIRIKAASAHSYYIGVESSGLSIPGVARPLKALCVAPFGMEEGEERIVPSSEFELVIGEPVLFRFFSSTTRTQDQPGDVVDWYESDDNSELLETTPIETTLLENPNGDSANIQDSVSPNSLQYVLVRFRSVVTELGQLEIWCEEVQGSRAWKLEFNVREE